MKLIGDDDVIEITVKIVEGEDVKSEGETTKKSKKTKQKEQQTHPSK